MRLLKTLNSCWQGDKNMIFFDIDGTLLDYEAAERNGIIDFFQIYIYF